VEHVGVVRWGRKWVMTNRRSDGTLDIRDDLIFHGGTGATLEMREFGLTSLRDKLLRSGFCEAHFLTENIPAIGIYFDHDVSQPLIARKQPFVMERWAVSQLIDAWRAAGSSTAEAEAASLRAQVEAARESRWLQLGRALGLGPKL